MEKTAEKLEEHGYRVSGFVVRKQQKRKRVNGRARGFYEGIYVYLRVIEPGGKKRDIYLGVPGQARAPGRPKQGVDSRGSTAIAPRDRRDPGTAAGRRIRGEKVSMLDRCEKCGREYGEHAGTKCPPPREEYDTRQHHPKQMKMPWEK